MRYLPQAIASVVAQTFDDFEFIIYDDGGDIDEITDCYDSVEAYFQKIVDVTILSNSEPKKGFAYALNQAVTDARGRWIVSVDDDDILETNALATVASVIQNNPEGQFLYSDYREIDSAGKWLRKCKAPTLTEIGGFDLHGVLPFHLTAYRKSLYELVGGTDLEQHKAVDVDLYLKMLEQTVPVYIPELLYNHRLHGDRMGSDPDEQVLYAARAVRKAVERRGLDLNVRCTWTVTNPSHYPIR